MQQIISFQPKIFNWKFGCIGSILGFFIFMFVGVLGMKLQNDIEPEICLVVNLAVFGAILWYMQQYKRKKSQEILEVAEYVQQYNQRVDAFNEAVRKMNSNLSERDGSNQYYQMRSLFERDVENHAMEWKATHPNATGAMLGWQWTSILAVLYCLAGCSLQFGMSVEETPSSQLHAAVDNEPWSAENIPMPHLTDGEQYVSNPDSILSANTVDSLNKKMGLLDDSLGIETAVIVVNHIKDDDPYRFAQDVFKYYGVGRNDRGLVILLAYGDRAINMSTGVSLEADLTDAECGSLQRRYLIPYMKVEQPDSGMLSLADGLLALMFKKEMPPQATVSTLKSDDSDMGLNKESGYILFYMVMMAFWYFMVRRQSREMDRLAGLPGKYPDSNPFFAFSYSGSYSSSSGSSYSSSRSSSSYSSSRSSSSSSSSRSSGYGGGHSGGGGATSRW